MLSQSCVRERAECRTAEMRRGKRQMRRKDIKRLRTPPERVLNQCFQLAEILFEFNFSAGFFELLLQALCVSFGKTFLNVAGGVVNELFSFLEAEAGELLDELNDSELAGASCFEHYVEAGFLLSGGCTGSGTGSYCYSCSSRLNAIFLLEDSCEFVYFFYGQVYQLFCKSFQICHFRI